MLVVLAGGGAGAFLGRAAYLEARAKNAPMARIPGGKVSIGNASGPPEERPVHEVTLAPYQMDLTEVTVAAYAVCVKSGACKPPQKGDFCSWGKEGRDDHPITCVDHDQAAAYCAWAGKRLPTEKEWEFAARGADGRRYPWGNERPGPTRSNVCGSECRTYGANRGRNWPAMHDFDDGFPLTAPVGSFPLGRSAFGLEDMGGNVREWTASPYCPYPDETCGNEIEFVMRGAGWANHYMMNVEATTREAIARNEALEALGFRCAR